MSHLRKGFLMGVFVLLATPALSQQDLSPVQIRAVDWSPTGNQLALGLQSGTIQVVQPDSSSIILELKADSDTSLYALDWNSDGTQLAVGRSSTIQVWNIETGVLLYELQQQTESIRALDWHPAGRLLATVSQDGFPNNVYVWDVASRENIFSPVVGDTLAVAWSPNGNVLAISKFGEIQLWDVTSQSQFQTITTPEYVVSLAWSPDGRRLASADTYTPESSAVRIWDTTSGALLDTFEGYAAVVTAITWDPLGELLVSASYDGTVRVINVMSDSVVATYNADGIIFDVAYSPYGGQLAIGAPVRADMAAMQGDSTSVTQLPVQIIVPDPSPERLQAIAAQCGAPLTVERGLDAAIAAADYADVIAQIDALPAGTIPPACAADLRAVAAAMQGQ
ncbi:MAG: WD40 repeat domain-containing protein [bacterium]|nr:WD40 repeat domain-containing protein [bacterium]